MSVGRKTAFIPPMRHVLSFPPAVSRSESRRLFARFSPPRLAVPPATRHCRHCRPRGCNCPRVVGRRIVGFGCRRGTRDSCRGTQGNTVLTVVVHPSQVANVVTSSLDHYSLTRLYADVAGVPYLNNAATAASMSAAFGLPTPSTTGATTTGTGQLLADPADATRLPSDETWPTDVSWITATRLMKVAWQR